jgi:predicted O-methyltransferase YrrM
MRAHQGSSLAAAQETRFNSAWVHRMIASSRVARALSIGTLARLELAVLAGHKQAPAMRAIRAARTGRESLLSGNEAFTVYSVARAQSALAGEMAEVGVYQGCSAKIISTASGATPLHLFDTFAGLPSPEAHEQNRMRTGHYAASLASVQSFLSGHRNITYHEGLFPGTAEAASGRAFSFVHLDVDLKSSTLACLEFFYPRLVPGGVILTHDYSYLDGVRAAFDEFLSDKDEHAIELPTSQALLVKR